MGGIVGRLFREFAVTLSVAIAVSMVVSLTTTPMMCANLLKPHEPKSGMAGCIAPASAFFNAILAATRRRLRWVLRHQLLIWWSPSGTVGLTVYLYIIVPKGFFPSRIRAVWPAAFRPIRTSPSRRWSRSSSDLSPSCRADPAVAGVMAFTGGSAAEPANAGRIFIIAQAAGRAEDQRRRSDRSAAAEAGTNPRRHPVLAGRPRRAIGGRAANAQYQYTLQGDNLKELNDWAPQAARKAAKLPESERRQQRSAKPRSASRADDRSRTAASLGITPQAIDDTLYDAFGQRQVSTMYMPLNQYHVVMEVDPQFRQNPDALQNILCPSAPAARRCRSAHSPTTSRRHTSAVGQSLRAVSRR